MPATLFLPLVLDLHNWVAEEVRALARAEIFGSDREIGFAEVEVDLVEVPLSRYLNILAMLCLTVFVACGENKTETSTIPAPVDPTKQGGGDIDVVENSDNLPADVKAALQRSAPLTLADVTGDYPGLQAVAGVYGSYIPLPIVGVPRLTVDMPNGSTTTFSNSKLQLAVEGSDFFWYLKMQQFKGTGTRSNNEIDAIFADDLMVVRTKGALSGGVWSGTVYYRVRQSGENQCKAIVVTCPPGYPYPCPAAPDTVAPCKTYMSTSSANVKTLGSFNVTASQWKVLPEGN